MYTRANTWFSNEEGIKGQIKVGQLADFAVLSDDYFSVPEDDIRHIESVLTVVDGKIVYGDRDFKSLDPGLPAPMPDWSPANFGSRYWKGESPSASRQPFSSLSHACVVHGHAHAPPNQLADPGGFWGALGCSCWAF